MVSPFFNVFRMYFVWVQCDNKGDVVRSSSRAIRDVPCGDNLKNSACSRCYYFAYCLLLLSHEKCVTVLLLLELSTARAVCSSCCEGVSF